MLFVQSILVVNVFVQIVYSEWIEIAQPVHSLNEAANNRSFAATNENTFDFSTYKDFFSIIEPDKELVKNITSVQKSSIFSNKLSAQNGDSGFHMIMVNPTEENHSKVSTLIDEMAESQEKTSEIVSEKQSPEKIINTTKKSEQPTYGSKHDSGIFKRFELKPLDFNNILKFLTNMQQSFAISSLANVGDKVKFLVQFKENILENIGDRLKTLWPSQQDNRRIRRSPSGHGGVDFPASETALMTISFLTLAVFLIKLVLQVIHTIKSKHVGLQTMTTSAANETPIKIIKANLNARKLSMSNDDLQRATETIASRLKMYT